MKWLRVLTPVVAAAALLAGVAAPAQASSNSGWVYTTNHSGGAYFDADLNGYPGVEKITVCDNKSDGRGIEVWIQGNNGIVIDFLKDPSHNGKCESMAYNMLAEETPVHLTVFEYWGENKAHIAYSAAIA